MTAVTVAIEVVVVELKVGRTRVKRGSSLTVPWGRSHLFVHHTMTSSQEQVVPTSTTHSVSVVSNTSAQNATPPLAVKLSIKLDFALLLHLLLPLFQLHLASNHSQSWPLPSQW